MSDGHVPSGTTTVYVHCNVYCPHHVVRPNVSHGPIACLTTYVKAQARSSPSFDAFDEGCKAPSC